MEKNFRVFYCWQSDKPEESNYIHYALKKSIYNINNCVKSSIKTNDVREQQKIELDEYFLHNNENHQSKITLIESDLKGSNNNTIAKNIMNNIKTSDIFICDLTPITEIGEIQRQVPNPNVMFELGVAVSTLGWGNILMLTKTKHDYPRFPFDVNDYTIRHLKGKGCFLLENLLQENINCYFEHCREFEEEREKMFNSQYKRLIIGRWIDTKNNIMYSFDKNFNYSKSDEFGTYQLHENKITTHDKSFKLYELLSVKKVYTILNITPTTLMMTYRSTYRDRNIDNIVTLKKNNKSSFPSK